MKKRILSFALVLCFVLTLLPAAFADSAPTSGTCGENVTWRLDGNKLTISGTGDMYDYDDSWDNSAPWKREYGDMITEVVIKQGVTSIGDHAFEWLGNLTSVQLPSGLKSIGASAFRYCYDLESINVSADNSTYSSEEGVLFNKDKTELLMYPAAKTNTSYTVPSSVVRIGEWAFSDCESLESISLPEGLTTIGSAAFAGCGLKSITIPSSVIEIEDYSYGDNLESINVSAGNRTYSSENGVLFNKNKTELLMYPRAKADSSYTVPGSVVRIDDDTFWRCYNLKEIIVSEGVSSIGYRAFGVCDNLESITLPESLTKIDLSAVLGCDKLKSITIPSGVTEIVDENPDAGAMVGNSIENINVSAGNKVFSSENGVVFNKDKTELILYPAAKADNSYTVPNGVVSIAESAFLRSKLKSVTIPNGVKNIGNSAFSVCLSLEKITIPNSVTSMGEYAFLMCRSLTSVTMPNNISKISYGTFNDCESLKNITIPSSVKSIDHNAFAGCHSLEKITIPDSVTYMGEGVFDWCSSLASVTIPNNISQIGSRAFRGCENLKSVTIPGGVKSICKEAFYGCYILSDVYYKGTAAQWEKVIVDMGNNPLDNATIHYASPKPAAPALKITTSAGKPKIYWNAVDGAAKYWVYRSTDGKNFRYYDSTTKTSYTNNSTSIGTTYYYKVKAVAVVDGKNYASDYSVSKGILCKPAAPTVSINRSNGKPKLSWKAVSGATKYWIYRSTDGVNFKYWDCTTKTSYTNSGAASGTKYYYRVKAVAVVNGKNVVSANSSTKSLFTSLAKPSVSITTSNGKPKLTWKAVTGADKYYIYRSTDGKNFSYWDSTTKTSYVNTGAKKNTKYYYKVKAVCASNSNANSAQSSTVSIKATK